MQIQFFGEMTCEIEVTGSGYRHNETQIWELNGPPQQSGSIWIYPAVWSTRGMGGGSRAGWSTRWDVSGKQSTLLKITPLSNPDRWLFGHWSTQVRQANGVVGTQSVQGQNPETTSFSFESFEAILGQSVTQTRDSTNVVKGSVLSTQKSGNAVFAPSTAIFKVEWKWRFTTTDESKFKLMPGPENVIVSSMGEVSLKGAAGGLFVGSKNSFPDPISLKVQGRVEKGSAGDNPDLSIVQVGVDFSIIDNPTLAGIVNQRQPVQVDGTWEVSATLFRTSQFPPLHTVHGTVILERREVEIGRKSILIEDGTLEWLLELFDREERQLNLADPLQFVARVRKVLNPARVFDLAIGRAEAEPPLYSPESNESKRLVHVAKTIWEGKEYTRIGHTLVGIEAGHDPRPKIPAFAQPFASRFTANLVNLVTWAGDLGGALRTFLFEHYFPAIFHGQRQYESWERYVEVLVTREQLIADIDGISLMSQYNRTQSLVSNLRSFYGADLKRYLLYIVRQRNEEGVQALELTMGNLSPILTDSSYAYIANTIAFSAEFLLAATLIESHAPLNTPYPAIVVNALKSNSKEVDGLARIFVNFLQEGLRSEIV